MTFLDECACCRGATADRDSSTQRCSLKSLRRLRWQKIVCALLLTALCVPANADSAIDMLSGFDAARIDAAYPPEDEQSVSELAKLLYRLRKADKQTLTEKANASRPAELGDAIIVDGQVKSVRRFAVPESLVEFLEFERFQEAIIESGRQEIIVVTTDLPKTIARGDHVKGIGVAVGFSGATAEAMAAGRLQWFPAAAPSPGIQLLSEHGVDVSALADVSTRNRKPLASEDADAFYPMLAAATRITPGADLKPQHVLPLDLLREPDQFAGTWLTMRVNTVRITRISVVDASRRAELGSDHYFQIDAMGNLGDTIVRIERPEGETGDPIQFENTYPVSLVAVDLPAFLSARVREQEGGDAVAAMISVPMQIEGFFFRLWSYESDFMDRLGGGEQFGPLIVISHMRELNMDQAAAGVEMIGYIAAAAVILGIVVIAIWTRRTEQSDDAERKKRRDREAASIQLPSDS